MQDEEVQIREYDWHLMKRLLVYLKPYKARIVIAFLLMLATACLATLTPYLVKVTIDRYITRRDIGGINLMAMFYCAVLVAQMVLSYLQVYIMQMTGQSIMYDMRVQLFSRLQTRELNFFHRNPVGRLMTRITNDVDTLNELFTSGVVSIFGDLLTLSGIMIAMLAINFQLAKIDR